MSAKWSIILAIEATGTRETKTSVLRWKPVRQGISEQSQSGELECVKGFGVVIHVGDTTYAVNGGAIDLGYKRIDPIWRPDPTVAGLKVDMGPLISAGRALCKR